MPPGPGRGGRPSPPRGGVEETDAAPAGRERETLTAGMEALTTIVQGHAYLVARYILGA